MLWLCKDDKGKYFKVRAFEFGAVQFVSGALGLLETSSYIVVRILFLW